MPVTEERSPGLPARDSDGADADWWAARLQGQGETVVRTVGDDLPRPLLVACGLAPVALRAAAAVPRGLPATALDEHGQRLLGAILTMPAQPLLVATNHLAGAQLFSVLRELMRQGEMPARALHGIDLLRPRTAEAVQYNLARLRGLADWAQSLGGRHPPEQALAAAFELEDQRIAALARLGAHRPCSEPRLSGTRWWSILAAGDVLPASLHVHAIEQALARLQDGEALAGTRVCVTGLGRADGALVEAIERAGAVVVADDASDAAGDAHETPPDAASAQPAGPWRRLATLGYQATSLDPVLQAKRVVARARTAKASAVMHVYRDGDEAQPWLHRWLAQAAEEAGLSLQTRRISDDGLHAIDGEGRLHATQAAPTTPSPRPARPPLDDRLTTESGGRSRKALNSLASFSSHQREWFQSIRSRALAGEPFAVVNADAPQEILRALDIPFVVNQWWASLVAAKQQSRRYLGLLKQNDYPVDAEAYSAQGLAAAFDEDLAAAPWGGLPAPTWLMAFDSSPATRPIYTSWARHTGAKLLLFDRTAETRLDLPMAWWHTLPSEWERDIETARLDITQAAFERAASHMARVTGRTLDESRFQRVLELVNEQETYYRMTRDLIAAAPRAPVSVADTMPATMVPQWHRGTEWGRDAARAFHDEIKALVEHGTSVCADERIRLMWVGRGLWSSMAFYQAWEESHGAVFVWSMYLALAADGYLRHVGPAQSPMRALASRFVTMGDELRMPTWAGAWHVHEARTHRIDAAVAVDDADPLVLRALETAGIPVLRLAMDNFAVGPGAVESARQGLTEFLDRLPLHRTSRQEPAT